MFYGEKLQALREDNKMSLLDVGIIIRFDSNTYNNYEKENVLIPTKHLNTLCNYFNVSFDYMFNFKDSKQYKNVIKNINKELVGQRLKSFREELHYTQSKLADLLNISRTTISEYENGHVLITIPVLYKICDKFGISADYLLGKIDKKVVFNRKN